LKRCISNPNYSQQYLASNKSKWNDSIIGSFTLDLGFHKSRVLKKKEITSGNMTEI